MVESPHQTNEVTRPDSIQITIINLVSYNITIKMVPWLVQCTYQNSICRYWRSHSLLLMKFQFNFLTVPADSPTAPSLGDAGRLTWVPYLWVSTAPHVYTTLPAQQHQGDVPAAQRGNWDSSRRLRLILNRSQASSSGGKRLNQDLFLYADKIQPSKAVHYTSK